MKYILIIFCFLFACTSSASTIDDIKLIESNKNINQLKTELSKKVNIYTLTNGKKIDLNDWQIVLFMQSTCTFCHKFDPVLKIALDEIKLPVFVFSFDGVGDNAFPEVMPVNNEIVSTFFRDIPVATPTTFLVNINNLITAPVSQGDMSKIDFINSLNNAYIQLIEEGHINAIN